MPSIIIPYRATDVPVTPPKRMHGGDPQSRSRSLNPHGCRNAGRNRNVEHLANAHLDQCRNPVGTACQGAAGNSGCMCGQFMCRGIVAARVFLARPSILAGDFCA